MHSITNNYIVKEINTILEKTPKWLAITMIALGSIALLTGAMGLFTQKIDTLHRFCFITEAASIGLLSGGTVTFLWGAFALNKKRVEKRTPTSEFTHLNVTESADLSPPTSFKGRILVTLIAYRDDPTHYNDFKAGWMEMVKRRAYPGINHIKIAFDDKNFTITFGENFLDLRNYLLRIGTEAVKLGIMKMGFSQYLDEGGSLIANTTYYGRYFHVKSDTADKSFLLRAKDLCTTVTDHPFVSSKTDLEEWLSNFFKESNVLIIGGDHSGYEEKFIIKNLAYFRKRFGVEDVYLEGLVDECEQERLDSVEDFTFLKNDLIVKAIKQQSMRCIALETVGSYFIGMHQTYIGRVDLERIHTFNYVAAKKIDPKRKSIVFVGIAHATIYDKTIGLRQLVPNSGVLYIRKTDDKPSFRCSIDEIAQADGHVTVNLKKIDAMWSFSDGREVSGTLLGKV